jgi:hypothetical protein
MSKILSALAVANLTASPLYAKTVTYGDQIVAPRATTGHETPAPAWSFACMTDHGPSQCGQPIWVYR